MDMDWRQRRLIAFLSMVLGILVVAVLLAAGVMAPLAGVGMACGAFLGLFAHPAVLPALIPLTGAAAWLLGGDPLTALLTLPLFLPVFVLRRLLAAQLSRTAAICRLSACCALVFLPTVYVTLWRAWGIASPGEMIDAIMAGTTDLFRSVKLEQAGEAVLAFSEEQAAAIAQLFVVLLPAAMILLCNLAAWLGHGLALLLFRVHGLGKLLTPGMRVLTLSRMAAVVFILGCLGSVVFGTGTSIGLMEAAALNLVMLFEPPFVLIGLSAATDFFRRRETVGGLALAGVILALLTCSLSVLLLIVACIGVARTLRGTGA